MQQKIIQRTIILKVWILNKVKTLKYKIFNLRGSKYGTNIFTWFLNQLKRRCAGFTDAQVDVAQQLDKCAPMTNDLDSKLVESICSKLKKGDGACKN